MALTIAVFFVVLLSLFLYSAIEDKKYEKEVGERWKNQYDELAKAFDDLLKLSNKETKENLKLTDTLIAIKNQIDLILADRNHNHDKVGRERS